MRTARGAGIVVTLVVALLAAAAAPAGASIFFDDATSSIGWVPSSGTGAEPKLVRTTHPWDVAADRKYVYWARRYCCATKTQFIGRARRDGSQVKQAFITIPGLGPAQSGIDSVAVDSGHMYWTDGNVIGRANLDGSNVRPTFITFAQTVSGIGDVQASGGKLYFTVLQFTGTQQRSIGRADASGANVVLTL